MKKYLIRINSNKGAVMHIAFNSDNIKPIYIYYCGMDTGKRFSRIGNAAKHLEKIAAAWTDCKKQYGTAKDIPAYGTNKEDAAAVKREYYNNTH